MAPEGKPGPDWSESDRAAFDALKARHEREQMRAEIEAEDERRRIAKRESIRSWATWLTAVSAAWALFKDGVKSLWHTLQQLWGMGP